MQLTTAKTQLVDTLKIYSDALSTYPENIFGYKSQEDVWSLAEMFEHLAITSTHFFLANCKRCLEKHKGQFGGEMNESGKFIMKNGGFPPIEVKVPGGGSKIENTRTLQGYQDYFRLIADSTEKIFPQIEKDEGAYKIQHPRFGFLNAQEWFINLEMHLRHHLRQKEKLEKLAS